MLCCCGRNDPDQAPERRQAGATAGAAAQLALQLFEPLPVVAEAIRQFLPDCVLADVEA